MCLFVDNLKSKCIITLSRKGLFNLSINVMDYQEELQYQDEDYQDVGDQGCPCGCGNHYSGCSRPLEKAEEEEAEETEEEPF